MPAHHGERRPLRPPAPTIIEAAESVDLPTLQPPPPRVPQELPQSVGEAGLRSIIESLREEMRDEFRESRAEPAKKKSVFDSIKPKTGTQWAIGIAAVVTALTAGIATVVTSIGGGEGLAAVFHAPKLREQIDAQQIQIDSLESKIKSLESALENQRTKNVKRFDFVGSALCKGAMTTARGLDCDAVRWDARPIPRKGEAPEPWRARDYEWPKD